MKYILIGLRASGKTSIGKSLANAMGLPCVDTDALALEEVQSAHPSMKNIAQIFEALGEPVFRAAELAVFGKLLAEEGDVVICTGGGLLMQEACRARIQPANHCVLYLAASPECLAKRMLEDPITGAQRPELVAGGALVEMQQMSALRHSVYKKIATHILDAEQPVLEIQKHALSACLSSKE